jgi:uncharacterized protein YdaU (DUF1376 family)
MAEKRPYFPFYPKDWLGSASVSSIPLAAQGLYMRLLAFAWLSDGLPSDEDALRRLAGVERPEWKRLWPAVKPLWTVHGDRLENRKLEAVRSGETSFSEAKSEAGKASARARLRRTGTAQPSNRPRTEPEQPPNRTPNTRSQSVPNETSTAPEPSVAVAVSTHSSPNGSECERARALARRSVDVDPNDPGPSPAMRRRAHAAWEGAALYVTTQQHQDFVARLTLGGMHAHEADRTLRVWYAATEDDVRASGTVPGDNILRFWDAKFAARPDVTRTTDARVAKPSALEHNARMLAELEARHG